MFTFLDDKPGILRFFKRVSHLFKRIQVDVDTVKLFYRIKHKTSLNSVTLRFKKFTISKTWNFITSKKPDREVTLHFSCSALHEVFGTHATPGNKRSKADLNETTGYKIGTGIGRKRRLTGRSPSIYFFFFFL